jgi:serine/threonine protein phosphatase PrpC
MGAYLDTPITDKHSESGTNDMASWGAVGMQGWRCGMEDTHIAEQIKLPNNEGSAMLFGVFDGHGGSDVAKFAQDHFR